MFKIYIKIIVSLLFISMSSVIFSQNVGINKTGATPSQNAILDLNTGNPNNFGFIAPHVTLGASLSTFNPPIAHANTSQDVGMLVFNSNAVNQPMGYYYWNGVAWASVTGAGGGGGNITPCGAAAVNYIPYFTSSSVICNSVLYQATTTTLGAGTITPLNMLDVNGAMAIGSYAGVNTAPANGMIISGRSGIDTIAPNSSAILDVNSTTKGLLIPELTTAQITGIAAPANGLIVYNTTLNCYELYTTGAHTGWNSIVCICNNVPAAPGLISPTGFCEFAVNQTITVPLDLNATSYNWTLSSDFGPFTGNGTPAITVSNFTAAGTTTITVSASNACGTGPSSVETVQIYNGNPTGAISPASLCFAGSGATDLVSITGLGNYTNIIWSVSSNSICSAAIVAAANLANSSTLTLSGGYGGSGTVTATISNPCGGISTTTSSSITYTPGGKQVFNYTGALQPWTVPACVSQITVEIWGAGGGSAINYDYYQNGAGGSGAYVGGTYLIAGGTNLDILVGGGGQPASSAAATNTFGGGAAGIPSYYISPAEIGTASGGGRSAIQNTSGTDLITAGAGGSGGGGGPVCGGGAGGAPNGSAGYNGGYTAGGGGTTVSGGAGGNGSSAPYNGTAGTLYQGGSCGPDASGISAGSGGGGYYGGGGGGSESNISFTTAGGGGGSSYTTNLAAGFTNTAGNRNNTGITNAAPNNGSSDYETGVGAGASDGTGYGGNGEIVIYW